MPRYFFHYHCGGEICRDEWGIDFSDIEAAYDSAFKGAVDMWTELLRERIDPRECAFTVADARGQALFKLQFADVLMACRKGSGIARFGSRAFFSVSAAGTEARRATVLRESRAVTADDVLDQWPGTLSANAALSDEPPAREIADASRQREISSPTRAGVKHGYRS